MQVPSVDGASPPAGGRPPRVNRIQAAGPVDRAIGARVRLLRLASGMSMEQLGARIGVNYQQVQKYETGRNRISCARLLAICQALKVHPMMILDPSRRYRP